jgi:Fungal protein kinase
LLIGRCYVSAVELPQADAQQYVRASEDDQALEEEVWEYDELVGYREVNGRAEVSQTKLNRVRRRVVLRDYGKDIYKISSRVVIFAALEDHITGKKCKQRMAVLRTDNDRA